jgi:hypothetical protein
MMNIYIGKYWVPFPSSEYGGTWSVIAENEAQCVELLKESAYEDVYDYSSLRQYLPPSALV